MSIQEHLNKIRNAIYGREVRESIAKGIETAYDDASEKDNANMEVKIARGTHPNLRSRLEEVDNTQQQTTAQLAQKTSKGEIGLSDLNKNKTQFDETWFTDSVKQQWTGNTPIHAVPEDRSIISDKIAKKAINVDILDEHLYKTAVQTEKYLGSNDINTLVGEKNLSIFTSGVTDDNTTYVLNQESTETGLVTIHTRVRTLGSITFMVLDRKAGTNEFRRGKSCVINLKETGTTTIETDLIIQEGQYIGFHNSGEGRIGTRTEEGIESNFRTDRFKEASKDTYEELTSLWTLGLGLYYQVGGFSNKLQNLLEEGLDSTGTNVKSFGAKGDGISDDTQAIQEAINTASGGQVFIPKGTYKVTNTIWVPSNTMLYGEGESSKIILGDGFSLDGVRYRTIGNTGAFPIVCTDEGSSGVIFKDFAVEGNRQEFRNQRQFGIAFVDSTNGKALNVSVRYINWFPEEAPNAGTLAYNIATVRSKNIDIIGGTFEYGGYESVGIADDSEDILVFGNYIGTAWRTSYQTHRGAKNVTLASNVIVQDYSEVPTSLITNHGMPEQPIINLKIIDNDIRGTREGVDNCTAMHVWDTIDYEIKGNRITEARDGISFFGENGIITGNSIYAGYALKNTLLIKNTLITNNVFNSDFDLNIVFKEVEDLVLSNNIINISESVRFVRDVNGLVLQGNVINTPGVGIRFLEDGSRKNILISNNKISSDNVGIYVDLRTSVVNADEISIIGNFINNHLKEESANEGISVLKGQGVTVSNNNIKGKTQAIRFESNSDYNLITTNNLRGCSEGIVASGENNVIANNLE